MTKTNGVFHNIAKFVGGLNPLQAALNIGAGIATGSDAYGEEMSGGGYVWNTLGTLPGVNLLKIKSLYGWRAISVGAKEYTFEIGIGFTRSNGMGISSRAFLGSTKRGIGLDFHSLAGKPFGSFAHLHVGIPRKVSMGQHISLFKLPSTTYKFGFTYDALKAAYIR